MTRSAIQIGRNRCSSFRADRDEFGTAQLSTAAGSRCDRYALFAVTDFKVGKFDIDLGVGFGLTSGSDRLVTKLIIGYAFPVPGKNDDSRETALKLKPMLHPTAYACQATGCFADLLTPRETSEALP